MSRFNTLLLREWMQHHRGWLVLMLLPPALVLLIVPFATLQVGPLRPLELLIGATLAVASVVLGITVAAVAIQAPGLARRDQQDRSIEFWMSLPSGHAASVGATVLAHLVLVPLLALAVGAVASQAIALALVAKVFGVAAWVDLPWATFAPAAAAALLRAALGVVLASLWLMPLVLLAMAASAWLKRWGLPVLAIGLTTAHALLARLYGITAIDDVFQGLLRQAGRAIVHGMPRGDGPRGDSVVIGWMADAPRWLASDALAALRELGTPLFALALLLGAVGFGLLVLRRRRAG